ncbi:Gag-Pol poly, partial [Paramuricea clavata]
KSLRITTARNASTRENRREYIDLLSSLHTQELLLSLKRFIARRGRPGKINSDNGKTFLVAAKWLRTVQRDEKLQDFLVRSEIHWQFNLSRAPWWGGQFERLIGLVKRSLHKTIGGGCLKWKELEEVLLDVEVVLNNRPLQYVEDDVQRPILTPNSLLFVGSNAIPELQAHYLEDLSPHKRVRLRRGMAQMADREHPRTA